MRSDRLGLFGDRDHGFRITRVGAEPVVRWGRDDESDLPRFTVLLSGWKFRSRSNDVRIVMGSGAALSGTVNEWDGEALVPSDPEPDIEQVMQLAWEDGSGYTIGELRIIAQAETRWRRFLRWLRR